MTPEHWTGTPDHQATRKGHTRSGWDHKTPNYKTGPDAKTSHVGEGSVLGHIFLICSYMIYFFLLTKIIF